MFHRIHLSLAAVILTLSGCAPMYATDYLFTAPPSDVGKLCTVECQNSRTKCERDENREYSMCMNFAGKDEQRRNECSKPDYNCTSHYHRCYQSCGGTITPMQRCVAFCDKRKEIMTVTGASPYCDATVTSR